MDFFMTPQNQAPARARPGRLRKSTLDKDLGKIGRVEDATRLVTLPLVAPGLALLFLVLAGSLAVFHIGAQSNATFIIAAAVIGGYMALTVGANDVANNVSPAVGARALTMTGALILAAIFESAGALLAGGDVVETISEELIRASDVPDRYTFVWIMMSGLLSAALWVHLATLVGAPISTTHSIVGGVAGAALAAVGSGPINWAVLGSIAASWVVSPLLGGFIAALLLALIKLTIIYRPDKIAAARRWVPLLIALMAGSFTAYLMVKGLERVWTPGWLEVAGVSVPVFLLVYAVVKPVIRRQSEGMENRNQSLRRLFRLPLIFSAALLSFAHGANDVANAVGPLAAILRSVDPEVANSGTAPVWVMMIGAFGISVGILLFGPRLVRLVGDQITKMNPMRGYCVALSTALTVLVASGFGLPVSSTHIAIGSIFGVGFFREYWVAVSRRRRRLVHIHRMRISQSPHQLTFSDQQELRRRKLVRRSHFTTILAAWVITVPLAAGLAALLYTLIDFVR
ncbi:MAG: inorganic phosphate transporter [Hyphomicrobium zavarzinii]|nr:inorganic phosphate transporter [Hyphomicrobium zavarzinii]